MTVVSFSKSSVSIAAHVEMQLCSLHVTKLQAELHRVVTLINATTLMHKSTLSTNNFGDNHFGQKYQKQNILRIFRRL